MDKTNPKQNMYDENGLYKTSKYKTEFCQKVIELGGQGKLPEHWARACGVTKKTIHNWKDSIPEFAEAFEQAKEASKVWWLDCAQTCAINEPSRYNFNSVKFMLSAAFDMNEKTGTELSGSVSTTTSISFAERE